MTKINVLGSCVSRISLMNGELNGHGIYGENMQLGYFLDKQNIVSAMMPSAFSKREIDSIKAEEIYEPSRIHSLKQCLDKSAMDLLLHSDADYVVMDLYDFQNDFGIFNNNTLSYSFEEDNKLIRLVSAYRGNNYVFDDDEAAKNSDLFSDGSSLVNFKFNNNEYLDFNIDFNIRDNTLKVIFE